MHHRDLELFLGSFASGATRDNHRRQLQWLASHCAGPEVIVLGGVQGALALLLANEGFSVSMAPAGNDPAALERTLADQPDRFRRAVHVIDRREGLGRIDDESMQSAVLADGLGGEPQPAALVGELTRILQPSGRLLISEDLLTGDDPGGYLAALGDLFPEGWRLIGSELITSDWDVGVTAVLALERAPDAGRDEHAALVSGLLELASAGLHAMRRGPREFVDDGSAPVKVFVISTGRAGSQSISDEYGLLHEPDGPYPSIDAVFERARGQLLYGETSHFWKSQLDELMAAFPDATYVHLVRDGRAVVKSFQQRKHYLDDPTDLPFRNEILPPHAPEMGRFEKLCWYWTYWNTEIEKRIPIRVRLEDLLLSKRSNVGKSHTYWTDDEREVFDAVCGELMERYGYPRPT